MCKIQMSAQSLAVGRLLICCSPGLLDCGGELSGGWGTDIILVGVGNHPSVAMPERWGYSKRPDFTLLGLDPSDLYCYTNHSSF